MLTPQGVCKFARPVLQWKSAAPKAHKASLLHRYALTRLEDGEYRIAVIDGRQEVLDEQQRQVKPCSCSVCTSYRLTRAVLQLKWVLQLVGSHPRTCAALWSAGDADHLHAASN